MCYYNGQRVTFTEFIKLKDLEKSLANYPAFDVELEIGFDYSQSIVLKRVPSQTDFELVKMEWGFIPPYLRTRKDVAQMRTGGNGKPPILTLNAVGEELLLPRKIYRDAALTRRCLLLSSGFYEWRHIFGVNKKTGQPLKTAEKIPYHIRLRDRAYFYIAAIWTPWTDKETGEYVESFALVTTAANSIMAQIHNSKKRMPTVLTEDLAYEWMFGDLSEKRITEIATYQIPSEEMEAWTISKKFREETNPTAPVHYETVPKLI